MKVLLSHVLAVVTAVIFSQAVYAQEKKPQTVEEKRAETYQHFIKNTHALLGQAKSLCKSKECTLATVRGRRLIRSTVNKGQQGLIGQRERQQFHAALKAHLAIVMEDLAKQMPKSQKEDGPLMQFQSVDTEVECELCGTVYEQGMGICSLYTIVSPGAAGICSAAATIAYISCLDRWCQNSFFPDWFINNFDAFAWGSENEPIDYGGEYIMYEE